MLIVPCSCISRKAPKYYKYGLITHDYTEPIATSKCLGLSRSPYLFCLVNTQNSKLASRRNANFGFWVCYMKVCKANLYIFVMLVEKPDWLLYCDSNTFESTTYRYGYRYGDRSNYVHLSVCTFSNKCRYIFCEVNSVLDP